jgi:hypothetical protein
MTGDPSSSECSCFCSIPTHMQLKSIHRMRGDAVVFFSPFILSLFMLHLIELDVIVLRKQGNTSCLSFDCNGNRK